ncbi:MAG: response regulator [Caldilineaceae bacterium]|nr:response regulator [Caldilineaceae bacterium]
MANSFLQSLNRLNPYILVVGDRLLCTFLSNSLQKRGYTTCLARSGQEALKIIQHSYIDLVIVDAELPDTRGHVLCSELRGHADIPIILLHTPSDLDHIVLGLAAGADENILMPFQFSQVESCIERLLGNRVSQSAGKHEGAPISKPAATPASVSLCTDRAK